MAACSILRGIEYRAPCADERVRADKLDVVMRVEASVAIAATRNLSGRGASFCARKKNRHQLVCIFLCFCLLNSSFLLKYLFVIQCICACAI